MAPSTKSGLGRPQLFRATGIDGGLVHHHVAALEHRCQHLAGLDQRPQVRPLGRVDRRRHRHDVDVAVAQVLQRIAVAQPRGRAQFPGIHLQRRVLARTQFLDPRGADIEAHRVVLLAELHGEREADIAQADDGNLGIDHLLHPIFQIVAVRRLRPVSMDREGESLAARLRTQEPPTVASASLLTPEARRFTRDAFRIQRNASTFSRPNVQMFACALDRLMKRDGQFHDAHRSFVRAPHRHSFRAIGVAVSAPIMRAPLTCRSCIRSSRTSSSHCCGARPR